MNVKKIKLADIDPRIDGRIRPVDEGHAAIIAQAFEERGQETAIVVRYGSGAEDAPKYILVSGAHRLRAAELVGWDSIDASITKLNADEARLQEIDEIRRYDRPDTLFYLEPPYWGNEDDYGAPFKREDFHVLLDALERMEGRFVMSINDRPEVRQMFGAFNLEAVSVPYTVGGGKKQRAFGELIIAN